jgi:hypothetical protein
MPITELLVLLVLGAGVWFAWDSLSAREAAIAASRGACAAAGLLFLDDTVAIESLWPVRENGSQLKLRRIYSFEYSDTGNNRRKGSTTLLGSRVVTIYIAPHPIEAPKVIL